MIKAVINYFLDSNISNDHYGERKLLLHNMYACTELFVILGEEMNLIVGGTCRKKRISFLGDDERSKWPKDSERGTYRRL